MEKISSLHISPGREASARATVYTGAVAHEALPYYGHGGDGDWND